MQRKILLLCHGTQHDLRNAGFLTIAQIRSGAVLTLDADARAEPDFVHDFSTPVPKSMKAHLGTFDLIFPVACPGTHVFAGKDGAFLAPQVVRNLEALLKPGGLLALHTTLRWFMEVNNMRLAGMPQETYDAIQAAYEAAADEYCHRGVTAAPRKALVGSELRLLPKSAAARKRAGTRLIVQRM